MIISQCDKRLTVRLGNENLGPEYERLCKVFMDLVERRDFQGNQYYHEALFFGNHVINKKDDLEPLINIERHINIHPSLMEQYSEKAVRGLIAFALTAYFANECFPPRNQEEYNTLHMFALDYGLEEDLQAMEKEMNICGGETKMVYTGS
jgi:hypothetical protein